ncbi:hypothetical protein V8E36_006264 [Tilletia maclaganii]
MVLNVVAIASSDPASVVAAADVVLALLTRPECGIAMNVPPEYENIRYLADLSATKINHMFQDFGFRDNTSTSCRSLSGLADHGLVTAFANFPLRSVIGLNMAAQLIVAASGDRHYPFLLSNPDYRYCLLKFGNSFY